MQRCPVCEPPQIVIVISARPRARCERCGARRVQEGRLQRLIVSGPSVWGDAAHS